MYLLQTIGYTVKEIISGLTHTLASSLTRVIRGRTWFTTLVPQRQPHRLTTPQRRMLGVDYSVTDGSTKREVGFQQFILLQQDLQGQAQGMDTVRLLGITRSGSIVPPHTLRVPMVEPPSTDTPSTSRQSTPEMEAPLTAEYLAVLTGLESL